MNAPIIDEAAVDALARSVGLDIPPERRAILAERLTEMHAFAADFASLPSFEFDPAFAFDAGWPEEDSK